MSSPNPARQPWTVRVAMWSAAHRWPVIALWFVATIGLFVASLVAGGTAAQNAVSNDSELAVRVGQGARRLQRLGRPRSRASRSSSSHRSPTGTVDDPAIAAAASRTSSRG